MSDSSDARLFPYRCAECGSPDGFRSRSRNVVERFLLPVFLLRPVRCGQCFHRDYRLIFTPVRDRLSDSSAGIRPHKAAAATNRHVA